MNTTKSAVKSAFFAFFCLIPLFSFAETEVDAVNNRTPTLRSGPYYLKLNGYCDKLKLYVDSYENVYGSEVGCSGGQLYSGGIDPGYAGWIGFTQSGNQFLHKIFLTGTAQGILYKTTSTSIGSGLVYTWTLSSADEHGDSHLPSISDTLDAREDSE